MRLELIAEASAWVTWLTEPDCTDDKRIGFARWIMESASRAQAFAEVLRTWEGAGKAKPLTVGAEREWTFDRYRDGRLMAEGASTRAATEEQARENVASRYPTGDTFVLRDDIPVSCDLCNGGRVVNAIEPNQPPVPCPKCTADPTRAGNSDV